MAGNARPFRDFLGEHARGKTHDRLSDALQELVQAVADTGKKGEMTIKVVMKPAGEQGAFSVTVDPVLKLPKDAAAESLFFVTPDNNLTKQSPQQILDLAGNESGPRLAHKGIA